MMLLLASAAIVKLKTPNLDRLCHGGVRFVNGQVNVPICGSVTSQLSLWSAAMDQRLLTATISPGTRGLTIPYWDQQPTFMEHAGSHGYGVYGTGKIFHNGQEKQSVWNREHGYKVDWGPWTWDGQRPGKGWAACVGHQSLPFDTDAECLFASLGDIPDIPANPETGAPGYRGWRHGDNRPFRYVSDDDRDLMHDELNGQWAAEVLSRPHDDEPFMLCLGIGRPHSPLNRAAEVF